MLACFSVYFSISVFTFFIFPACCRIYTISVLAMKQACLPTPWQAESHDIRMDEQSWQHQIAALCVTLNRLLYRGPPRHHSLKANCNGHSKSLFFEIVSRLCSLCTKFYVWNMNPQQKSYRNRLFRYFHSQKTKQLLLTSIQNVDNGCSTWHKLQY